MKLRYLVLPLLLASSAAHTQVLLRLNLRAGRTYSYIVNMSTEQQMIGDMKVRAVQDFKVVKKVADRQTIDIITKEMKITAPKGSPFADPTGQVEREAKRSIMTATYNSRGALVGEVTARGGAAVAQNAAAMSAFNYGFMGIDYPARAVSPGYSWSLTVDFAKMTQAMGQGTLPAGMKVGGKPMVVRYTIKGFGTQKGKRVTNIGYTMKGFLKMSRPAQSGQPAVTVSIDISGTGTAAVDTSNGLPLFNRATMLMNVTAPMKITQKLKYDLTLK